MQIQTKEDAMEIANKIIRLEAAIKIMKNNLKAYCQNNGPVETEEMVFDFFTSVSWDFTPEAKKEMAIAIAIEGQNPYDLLDFSSANLKKIGWSESILLQYGTPKFKKSFRAKKKEVMS